MKKICPKILIVEDDCDHVVLLEDSLMLYYEMNAESRIVCVGSGADCLAQRLEEFDVILLDFYLPDMTGLEVLGEILDRVDLLVIFVTGENDLTVATEAIEKGAQDYIVKHGDYLLSIPAIVQKNVSLHKIKIEHDQLQHKLQWMLTELQSKNEQLEESMGKLRTMAITDPLTGLFNRRHFAEQLARQFSEARRYDNDLSCVMIDLDHFKEFNDTLGHQMGDKLLQTMAEEVSTSLRASDIAARYGGDEFVLLLPQTSTTETLPLLNRIREGMARKLQQETFSSVGITLSIGVASLKSDTPDSADRLVAIADKAMYSAKENGKDRIVTFTDLQNKPVEST